MAWLLLVGNCMSYVGNVQGGEGVGRCHHVTTPGIRMHGHRPSACHDAVTEDKLRQQSCAHLMLYSDKRRKNPKSQQDVRDANSGQIYSRVAPLRASVCRALACMAKPPHSQSSATSKHPDCTQPSAPFLLQLLGTLPRARRVGNFSAVRAPTAALLAWHGHAHGNTAQLSVIFRPCSLPNGAFTATSSWRRRNWRG